MNNNNANNQTDENSNILNKDNKSSPIESNQRKKETTEKYFTNGLFTGRV